MFPSILRGRQSHFLMLKKGKFQDRTAAQLITYSQNLGKKSQRQALLVRVSYSCASQFMGEVKSVFTK